MALALLRHDRLRIASLSIKNKGKLPIRAILTVLHGRARMELVLESEEATVADLKAALAQKVDIPIGEMSLVARGKRLTDGMATVRGVDKVMVIRKAPSLTSDKIKLNLRCLKTGRLARNVGVSANEKISTLADISKKALGMAAHTQVTLFSERAGKQCLRDDLSLCDYSAVGSGTSDLFVCPDSALPSHLRPPPPAQAPSGKQMDMLDAMMSSPKGSLNGPLSTE